MKQSRFGNLDAELAEHIATTQHTCHTSSSSGVNNNNSSSSRNGGQQSSVITSSSSDSTSRTSSSVGVSPLPLSFGDVERSQGQDSAAAAIGQSIESRQSQRGSTPPHVRQNVGGALMQPDRPPAAPPHPHGQDRAQGQALASPDISIGSSGNGTGSSSSGGNGQPHAVLIRQPPRHVMPNEWFELEVGLEFPSMPTNISLNQEQEHIEFVAQLHAHDPPGAGPSSEPISSGARLAVGGSGAIRVPLKPTRQQQQQRRHIPVAARPLRTTTKVLLKIDSQVSADRLTKYSVKFVPKPGQNLPATLASLQSQSIFARPIIMVSARLKVEAINWEPIWYKDEGGREKCMEVNVTLVDKNGDPVRGRRIPLKFTLLYDNGQSLRVMKQQILKVFGPDHQYINPASSSASVSFRIEDVSKNHQGMDFKVELGPDSARAGTADVAPGSCPPVSVRSKRNKRQRSSTGTHSRGTSHGSEQSFREQQMTATASSSANVAGGTHQQPAPPMSMAGIADVQALRAAMRGVIRWTEEVVNGLYPLKWQVIGYAQFPDGTVDYSRPYHSMPNPNDCITRVLSMYSDETRENLRTLLEAVENTTHTQVHGGNPSSAPAPPAAAAPYGAPSDPHQVPAHSYPPYPGSAVPAPPYPFASLPHQHGGPWQAQPPQQYGYEHSPTSFPMQHPGGPMLHPASQPIASTPNAASSMQELSPQQDDAAAASATAPVVDAAGSEKGAEPSREDIEYILAKPFKSISSGDKLGFPCYNAARDMIGFVRESAHKGFGKFIPISKYKSEFGPVELTQATGILNDAITNHSPSLHTKEAHSSVYSLIDHALVYDYSSKEGYAKRK